MDFFSFCESDSRKLLSNTFNLPLQSSYSVSYQAQSGSETNYAGCTDITETTCLLMFDTGVFPAPHSFTIRVYANQGTQRSTAASLSAQTDDPGAPPDIVSVIGLFYISYFRFQTFQQRYSLIKGWTSVTVNAKNFPVFLVIHRVGFEFNPTVGDILALWIDFQSTWGFKYII